MNINPLYHHSQAQLQDEMRWIRKAQRDPAAFEPIYRKYHEQIFRYIWQRIDCEQTAADVTSQVFLKALNNIGKYEDRGLPFGSWLYRIASNELNQAFRERKARRTVNVESVHLFEMMDEIEGEQNDENKKRLFALIKDLKLEEVRLLEMHYFERRSYREIAEILDISETNAKVRTHRVVKKLRAKLHK